MTTWLLKWLDVRMESGVDVAGAALEFRGSMGWGAWLLWTLLLTAAVYTAYRFSPPHLSRSRRFLLTTLRSLFLGSLLFLLLRPVLAFTVEGSVRRLLVILCDNSASLRIPDPRIAREDQVRAAIARNLADPAGGLAQSLSPADAQAVSRLPRIELVKGVLESPRMNLLARLQKHFDLAGYQFGGVVADLPLDGAIPATNTTASAAQAGSSWANHLDGRQSATALGDAVREVANRKRGQPLAGILLITDGANNSGSAPLEAAERLRSEGVPLHIYGVGLTAPRDVIVASLLAPEVTFVDEELDVIVRVRGQGLAGQTATVKLKLGAQEFQQNIAFSGGGEQVVTFPVVPQTIGEMEIQASIDPRSDEAVTDNNMKKQRIRVIDSRINVLLVDQSPRWEFRYLQAMLLRDRRVNLKCYLVEGDPGIARVEKSPYLSSFPTRREDLLKFDLVIFGDVDPRFVTPTQQEYLNELVSKFGGALLVVAGKRYTPHAYRRSALYPMLPVEFEGGGVEAATDANASDKPIRLELTSAGRSSPMMRLGDNELKSREIWQQMPPVYWVSRVSRPKPAAEVLMIDPDPARESRFGKMPVIALHQYGLGQVMFVGTDNTWRWRRNSGDAYYSAFWGQLVQRLALPRLLGGNKRIQLSADRQNYLAGDRVTLFGRLYSLAFEAIQEPVVKGRFTRKGQDRQMGAEVLMRPIQDQPGLYRGEFIAGVPGDYQFSVDVDPASPLEFSVIEPQFELGETAMNEALLRQMAKATAGGFYHEEDLHKLPDLLNAKTEKVRSPLEIDLWSSPLVFLLLIALASVEWVLRKLSYLK
ncbi:MAG: VWA domain-containing protein [Verrucomicrobia bacterium]|nr:VWA domain-containing protein [Verrucomicrobiota bacterium]MBI3868629.1 VWA domain-containing protein [Verrucomicrobiota bacterium]